MGAIREVTSTTFETEVMNSEVPVLIDLYAPWCGPCRMMAPVLEQVAASVDGRAKVMKINTDDEPELAAAFQVQSIPTVVLMQGGRVVDGFVGMAPAKAILAMIDKATLSAGTK